MGFERHPKPQHCLAVDDGRACAKKRHIALQSSVVPTNSISIVIIIAQIDSDLTCSQSAISACILLTTATRPLRMSTAWSGSRLCYSLVSCCVCHEDLRKVRAFSLTSRAGYSCLAKSMFEKLLVEYDGGCSSD